eukprot:5569995-Prymnesium_polylepis.1
MDRAASRRSLREESSMVRRNRRSVDDRVGIGTLGVSEQWGAQQRRMLYTLAQMLESISGVNSKQPIAAASAFDAETAPAIAIHDYLLRLRRYSKFDFTCFLAAVTYMDRLCGHDLALCLSWCNVHRVLLVALLVAAKVLGTVLQGSEGGQSRINLFMSRCGGIPLAELSALEVELCRRLDWALLPMPEELGDLREALEGHAPEYWDTWCVARMRPAAELLPAGAPEATGLTVQGRSAVRSIKMAPDAGGDGDDDGAGGGDGAERRTWLTGIRSQLRGFARRWQRPTTVVPPEEERQPASDAGDAGDAGDTAELPPGELPPLWELSAGGGRRAVNRSPEESI